MICHRRFFYLLVWTRYRATTNFLNQVLFQNPTAPPHPLEDDTANHPVRQSGVPGHAFALSITHTNKSKLFYECYCNENHVSMMRREW